MVRMMRFGLVLFCVGSLWSAPSDNHKTALDKATMEDYVRHLFVWGPQIQVKIEDPKPSRTLPGFLDVDVIASAGGASQTENFYVSKDGQKIIRGTVFNVGESPFEADLAKLKTAGAASFGPPGAPVQIIVFSDFECGFCKEEAKVLRDNLKATYPNEVQVFFKEFPLEAIHPWAKPAAIAGRCVLRQNASVFWDYHDYMFEHQADITAENVKAKILEFAKGKSLDEAALTSCIDTQATLAEVDQSIAQGKALGVNSTPTLFIAGRRIAGGIPWESLRQIIDYELGYQKTHGSAADKCCEMTLPTPLKK